MITSTSRKQTAPSGYSKKPSDNKLPIVIIAIIRCNGGTVCRNRGQLL